MEATGYAVFVHRTTGVHLATSAREAMRGERTATVEAERLPGAHKTFGLKMPESYSRVDLVFGNLLSL